MFLTLHPCGCNAGSVGPFGVGNKKVAQFSFKLSHRVDFSPDRRPLSWPDGEGGSGEAAGHLRGCGTQTTCWPSS